MDSYRIPTSLLEKAFNAQSFAKKMPKRLKNAASLLVHNHRFFLELCLAGVRALKSVPRSITTRRINRVLFEFDFDYSPHLRSMYLGAYEVATVATMKRFLKKGDTFIDVGANIGYLSAIALGLVGKTGRVFSFEPVPQHFQRLQNLAKSNPDYQIVISQSALGSQPGTAQIDITKSSNIGWNTMVPGFMRSEDVRETVTVPVNRLDALLNEDSGRVSLMKIDTEGFELPVLQGLSGYFERTGNRPPIICEIAPAAYPLMQSALVDLADYMTQQGYRAHSLTDFSEVEIGSLAVTTDVLFLSSAS